MYTILTWGCKGFDGAAQRRKASGRVGYLKTRKALIANKNETAKTVKFAAPVAAPAMAFAA